MEDDISAVPQQPVVSEISEEKIDRVMSMLNEADPTMPESDPIGNNLILRLKNRKSEKKFKKSNFTEKV